MSKIFRKFIKKVPQIFTILGAISVALAMLLSLVNVQVQANDVNASGLENSNFMNATLYREGNSNGISSSNIVPPTETTEPTPPTKVPPSITTEPPTPTTEPPSITPEPPTPTAEQPTLTVEAPTPTAESPTPTPTDPGTNLTPDVPVQTETPDPGETPNPSQEPTLPPPTSNDPPTILIPVTGSEISNQSPLDKAQTTLFNLGLGLLGLGLVLQSLTKKNSY